MDKKAAIAITYILIILIGLAAIYFVFRGLTKTTGTAEDVREGLISSCAIQSCACSAIDNQCESMFAGRLTTACPPDNAEDSLCKEGYDYKEASKKNSPYDKPQYKDADGKIKKGHCCFTQK